MSYLLAISVGPVQEFIAAARRTRDLWFGSYLLSEVGKAVAKSVREQHGELIFPHSDANLSPDQDTSVANVILAELPVGVPKEIAAAAKGAAQECWRKYAMAAREEAGKAIRPEQWEDQIDGVIEFYAAWVPHSDAADYRANLRPPDAAVGGPQELP